MGRLIVLEGVDGTGKTTQFELLCTYLRERGIPHRALTYPDYADESSTLVRMYLSGAFGSDPDAVSPYAASTFYACDRYASFIRYWKEDYEKGVLCLSCRYATSNAVHQGAKLPADARTVYYEWLSDLEYRKMGIPEPSRVVLLDMAVDTALSNIRARALRCDIHEADEAYLRRAAESAHTAAAYYGWKTVACDENGKMREREAIFGDILDKIRDLL
ncbi:MAG: thymidylate kinase [Clostridiaceae bacterium]|nr:thymidylate kinase [Clostridiaceae bacterium]